MDGVVTDTAGVHATAWKTVFDVVLLQQGSSVPFDADGDYRAHVDGRPRQEGVRTFLGSRGVLMSDGEVEQVAADKEQVFLRAIADHGVTLFPSAVALVRELRVSGVRTGLVTASRHARDLLRSAGVLDLFDVVVDGVTASDHGLAGKPSPASFLHAARALDVPARECVVVEDATAGVQAGAAGGFGLVVGVDRGSDRAAALSAAGADVVLQDLAELDPTRLPVLHSRFDESWRLVFSGFVPALEGRREALCTTANGYLGTRGAVPERAADGVHYPGTYLAGCFDRLRTQVDGQLVEHEDLVNAPNWLPLRFHDGSGTWFDPSVCTLLDYEQELDLRRGVLFRDLTTSGADGRVTRVQQERFVSMASPHLAVLRTRFTPQGWSGRVTVRAGLDGGVANGNVPDSDSDGVPDQHLGPVVADHDPDGVLVLEVQTVGSGVRRAMAARVEGPAGVTTSRRSSPTPGGVEVWVELELELLDGQDAVGDKVVAVVTSQDRAIATPVSEARAELARAGPVEELQRSHELAWERLWQRYEVEVWTDPDTSRAVHLHLFHVLQTLSPHLTALDAGVPARGLHGEGYRGHVFWDEALVFPLLTLRDAALSRALLLYRYRRLGAARDAALAEGRAGAMFPWQSGSDGREETPDRLFNPRTRSWMPDHSRLQRHVGLEIAYSVWHYFQATGDVEFLTAHGAEMMVEVARYLSSCATHDPVTDRYSIAGVMGPDEYHDQLPGSPAPGLRDNAYTNVLTAWLLDKAAAVLDLADAGLDQPAAVRLEVDEVELLRWEHMSRRLSVPFHADGVISQFDGYERLQELDWSGYRERYGNIGRLDLILAAEGDTTNRYRLSKQADVLMLLYLLSAEELRAVLERLDYALTPDALLRTVEFYTARAAHGSTLCEVVHAWVLARSDRDDSWPAFQQALRADVDDTQGGTTREGIHLAAMAGTVDLLQRGYTGLELRDGVMRLNPRLPEQIQRLRFSVHYRGHPVEIDVDHRRVRIRLAAGSAAPVRIDVRGQCCWASSGQSIEVHLDEASSVVPVRS